MVKSYRVFTGAPSVHDIATSTPPYRWRTCSTSTSPIPYYGLPPATFEAASRRISLLYQNIIFDDHSEEDVHGGGDLDPSELQEKTTFITWSPTAVDTTGSQFASRTGTSFLRPTASASRPRSQFQTQDTQDKTSYIYSDASSISRFPAFHFSLHALTPLSSLIAEAHAQKRQPNAGKDSRKVTVLAAVLELDGPDTIRIKRGVDAGKDVSLLKLILGDDDGTICKLTAWREVAESWGGSIPELTSPGVKRGDVLLLESESVNPSHLSLHDPRILYTDLTLDLTDVLASWGSDADNVTARNAAPVSFTASPHLKSRLEICYRTMPNMAEDSRLRPDLRLGFSDAAVRKVAAVVKWFEAMAGLNATIDATS
ncbi:uncharacterized protein LAESUDRAFT_755572 [Laetiporus sulphureus 93-53]|uniref:Nucleic acid-binding protein n=1 Tax=Laetiporus sulphureus 93-53 TaxID=1314785 RepID=A0A165GWW0_9APHY|nr:uncharacterized protein LAESUDRAFT_755572 [Laetiporus sulphureus 93-53]KZT10937.1 hypothetical protein LAESUDRAFT_755572 [Laetiporus sulphureus 93-53]